MEQGMEKVALTGVRDTEIRILPFLSAVILNVSMNGTLQFDPLTHDSLGFVCVSYHHTCL